MVYLYLIPAIILIGCSRTNETTSFGNANPQIEKKSLNIESLDGQAGTFTKTFLAGIVEPKSLSIDPNFDEVEQQIVLKKKKETVEESKQIDRTSYQETFLQGHDGLVETRSYPIADAGIFDLLVVIDNSSSMKIYQDQLALQLPSILKHISNTNWRIAVTTTSNPCLRPSNTGLNYITKADYDNDSAATRADFAQMIQVGEGGASKERGILMATQAVNETGCIFGDNSWRRQQSTISVLIVTDEENCGSATNEGCPGEDSETADYFIDNTPANTRVFALLLLADNDDCPDSGFYDDAPNPVNYINLVNSTSGIYSEICQEASEYKTVLESMSQNVDDFINFQYELEYSPEDGTVEIDIDGILWTKNFTIENKILTLDGDIPDNSNNMHIVYKHDPTEIFTEFQMTKIPAENTVAVYFDDTEVATGAYQIDRTNRTITFSDPPPMKSNIAVKFRENIDLPKSFRVEGDFVEETFVVKVDNKLRTDFSFDKNTRSIVFEAAPLDDEDVEIKFEQPNDRLESYDIEIDYSLNIEDVKAFDTLTGAPIKLELDQGKLKINKEDVSNGRVVTVLYNIQFSDEDMKFRIPYSGKILANSLKIDVDGDQEICTNLVDTKGGEIKFQCSDDEIDKINVKFFTEEGYINTFNVKHRFTETTNWIVHIDGKPTENFHVVGNQVIILKKYLPYGSKVKIIVEGSYLEG